MRRPQSKQLPPLLSLLLRHQVDVAVASWKRPPQLQVMNPRSQWPRRLLSRISARLSRRLYRRRVGRPQCPRLIKSLEEKNRRLQQRHRLDLQLRSTAVTKVRHLPSFVRPRRVRMQFPRRPLRRQRIPRIRRRSSPAVRARLTVRARVRSYLAHRVRDLSPPEHRSRRLARSLQRRRVLALVRALLAHAATIVRVQAAQGMTALAAAKKESADR